MGKGTRKDTSGWGNSSAVEQSPGNSQTLEKFSSPALHLLPGLVTHTCSPSSPGGSGRRIAKLGTSWATE